MTQKTLRLHPDKANGAPGASEEFQKVNEAYNALYNRNKKPRAGQEEHLGASDFQHHPQRLDPKFGQKLRREMEKSVSDFVRDHYGSAPKHPQSSQLVMLFAVLLFSIPLVFFGTFLYEREVQVVGSE